MYESKSGIKDKNLLLSQVQQFSKIDGVCIYCITAAVMHYAKPTSTNCGISKKSYISFEGAGKILVSLITIFSYNNFPLSFYIFCTISLKISV